MPDITDAFNNGGNSLGNLFGNPVAGRNNLNTGGNPWKHSPSSPSSARDGEPVGFLPPQKYGDVLNVPFVNNRTEGASIKSLETDGDEKQSPGFTPVQYYKAVSEEWSAGDPEYRIKITNDATQLRTTKEAKDQSVSDIEGMKDERFSTFRYALEDRVNFQNSTDKTMPSITSLNYDLFKNGDWISTHDNEDPVFFGFEIILNADTSPLLNGTVENFLEQDIFNSYTEMNERQDIIKEFKKELTRYFRMFGNPSLNPTGNGSYIFETSPNKRRYYINKLSGLHALNERNKPDASKSFVDYRKENIGVTFFEDTTLNLGTLYSLYKSLYWSRLNGKQLIPENILRFDCQIIISELRNLAAVKKAASGGAGGVEVLRSNISRYVYNLYECQFYFEKPTHGDEVDIGSQLQPTMKYDIEFDFKYSNMIFERFNPGLDEYAHIANDRLDPNGDKNVNNANRSVPAANFPDIDTRGDQSKDPIRTVIPNGEINTTTVADGIDGLIAEDKNRIKNLYGEGAPPVFENTAKDVDGAGKRLLNNLKTASLNESQRQLNTQFALLNNSLNKVRDSFGLTSRMSAPRNIYDPGFNQTGGMFYADVQNSLRNFGGDVLGGLL